MLKLGQKVYVVEDRLELNLPIGSYGYIIAYDKNPNSVYDYIIRVPEVGRHYYVTKTDIEREDELLRKEAEKVGKKALIDYALATRNEALFNQVMNGDDEQKKEEPNPHSQDEFIRQIHLKAWI